jgi:hypothetical protein
MPAARRFMCGAKRQRGNAPILAARRIVLAVFGGVPVCRVAVLQQLAVFPLTPAPPPPEDDKAYAQANHHRRRHTAGHAGRHATTAAAAAAVGLRAGGAL